MENPIITRECPNCGFGMDVLEAPNGKVIYTCSECACGIYNED